MKCKALLTIFFLIFGVHGASAIPVLISQIPDINTTNLLMTDLTVKYLMDANYSDINQSTVKMYFNTTHNGESVNAYVNGSFVLLGSGILGHSNNFPTNDTVNHTFTLSDDLVYHTVENMILSPATSCSGTCHKGADWATKTNPINKNTVYEDRQYNFTLDEENAVYEVPVNVTNTTGQSPLIVGFHNGGYSSGNIYSSANSTTLCSLLPSIGFDEPADANGLGERHCNFKIDVVNGTINGIKITADSYFWIQPQSTGWNIYYTNNITRPDQVRYSSNSGLTWSNFPGTLRTHLHLNGNDSFNQWACYNSTSTGARSCSVVFSDNIAQSDIPPVGARFTNPNGNNTFLSNTNMTVTWAAGYSLTDGVILGYNLSVWQTGTEILKIGNYSNTTFNATFNTSLLGVGTYNFRMITHSNKSLNTTTSSVLFTIYNYSEVHGYVYNVLELPIQNAKVDVTNMGNTHIAYTDASGYYTIPDYIEGDSHMLVRAIGYQNATYSHYHNETHWQNFTLKEKEASTVSASGFDLISILFIMVITYIVRRKQ